MPQRVPEGCSPSQPACCLTPCVHELQVRWSGQRKCATALMALALPGSSPVTPQLQLQAQQVSLLPFDFAPVLMHSLLLH